MRRGTCPMSMEKTAWDIAVEQFNTAADKLGLDDGTRAVLWHCKRELTVNFPVKMSGNVDQGLHRLSRPPQRGPRPGQGRHPLPPGRDPGRGQGPGDVDDLEVRRGRHPLRWRQGRRHRRPQAPEAARAGEPDAPLRHRDLHPDGARARHPRARRQHQRADHGLDHGHGEHAPRLHGPGRHHRQADRAWAARWGATRPRRAASASW